VSTDRTAIHDTGSCSTLIVRITKIYPLYSVPARILGVQPDYRITAQFNTTSALNGELWLPRCMCRKSTQFARTWILPTVANHYVLTTRALVWSNSISVGVLSTINLGELLASRRAKHGLIARPPHRAHASLHGRWATQAALHDGDAVVVGLRNSHLKIMSLQLLN